MRASGKFTPQQIKDAVTRVFTGKPVDKTVRYATFYVLCALITDADVGTVPNSPKGPWLLNSTYSPEGYLIMPADEEVTAKIIADGNDLLKRLADYNACFKVNDSMHH